MLVELMIIKDGESVKKHKWFRGVDWEIVLAEIFLLHGFQC
jgi:hypothetical protein